MSADAAFAAWFAGPFQTALQGAEIPGMAGASWDRKAAYLLWLATDGGRDMPSPSVSDLTTDTAAKSDRPAAGGIFD